MDMNDLTIREREIVKNALSLWKTSLDMTCEDTPYESTKKVIGEVIKEIEVIVEKVDFQFKRITDFVDGV
jgi:hypothetical protein